MTDTIQKFTLYRPKVDFPLPGVFYQLDCGQGFLAYSRNLRCEELGYAYRFLPCPLLEQPDEDIDFTEVINGLGDRKTVTLCDVCGRESSFTVAKTFQVTNAIPQPFIDEHVDYYVHKDFKTKLEKRGFVGLRFIPNSPCLAYETHNGFPCSLNSSYFYMESLQSSLMPVPGECEPKPLCSVCGFENLICCNCGRTWGACPSCHQKIRWEESTCSIGESTPGGDGSFWPLRLSSWDLSDICLPIVTGEVLEFLLESGFSPFAFTPAAVEAKGASEAQLQKARKVKRDIPVNL